MLGLLPNLNGNPITLELMLGYLFAPLAWFMGIPWSESIVAGQLLGVKTALNEFVAYLYLAWQTGFHFFGYSGLFKYIQNQKLKEKE